MKSEYLFNTFCAISIILCKFLTPDAMAASSLVATDGALTHAKIAPLRIGTVKNVAPTKSTGNNLASKQRMTVSPVGIGQIKTKKGKLSAPIAFFNDNSKDTKNTDNKPSCETTLICQDNRLVLNGKKLDILCYTEQDTIIEKPVTKTDCYKSTSPYDKQIKYCCGTNCGFSDMSTCLDQCNIKKESEEQKATQEKTSLYHN